MPFIPVPVTAEFELVQQLDGEIIENTLYFKAGVDWTPTTLTDFAQELVGWWSANMAPILGQAISLIRLECTDLGSATGPSVTYTTGLPVAGLVPQPAVALNVAPAIKFKTANRGRSFTGRNYIPGLTEANVNASRVDSITLEALETAYTALIGLALDNTVRWVVASRYSGVDPVTKKPIPRVVGLATNIISATFTDNVVDSQRRRLPGH